jgi:hypothetical protein
MNSEEWAELCNGLGAKAICKLEVWMKAEAVTWNRTPLGVQLFSKFWDVDGKYLLLTQEGDVLVRNLDPFN